jgi:hypothetical protein
MTIVVDVRVCVASQPRPIQSISARDGDAFARARTILPRTRSARCTSDKESTVGIDANDARHLLPVKEGVCGS